MKTIPLRNRKGDVVATTVVDDVDYDYISQWNWCLGGAKNLYARRNDGGKTAYMHRVILGLATVETEGDHFDGNKLNNVRSNLRPVPHSAQTQNVSYGWGSSKHRGVGWDKARGKWIARAAGKHLGRFDSEVEAASVAAAFRAQTMPYSADAMKGAS